MRYNNIALELWMEKLFYFKSSAFCLYTYTSYNNAAFGTKPFLQSRKFSQRAYRKRLTFILLLLLLSSLLLSSSSSSLSSSSWSSSLRRCSHGDRTARMQLLQSHRSFCSVHPFNATATVDDVVYIMHVRNGKTFAVGRGIAIAAAATTVTHVAFRCTVERLLTARPAVSRPRGG